MSKATLITHPEGFEVSPVDIMLLWGKKKSGKTIAAINSPWRPVHVLDSELSSSGYKKYEKELIKKHILSGPFTREDVSTHPAYEAEMKRLATENVFYGTIVADTYGQLTTWISRRVFNKHDQDYQRKMSRIIWGKVRDQIRNQILLLKSKCNLLILTSHLTEYNNQFSPRMNPTVEELADMSIRLERNPNETLPDAIIEGARLPQFPPKVSGFSIEKLIKYIDAPANWDDLNTDELVTSTTTHIEPEDLPHE